MTAQSGNLYIVATPIGNLDDISQRAIKTLSTVAWVAAEDTRHSGKLLSHLGISAKMLALHDHNEKQRAATLLQKLQAGEDVALISDAGTPLISDPGYSLVRLCRDAGVRVVPIPGPCALIQCFMLCGFTYRQIPLYRLFTGQKSAASERTQRHSTRCGHLNLL